jgi:hypothetical protein
MQALASSLMDKCRAVIDQVADATDTRLATSLRMRLAAQLSQRAAATALGQEGMPFLPQGVCAPGEGAGVEAAAAQEQEGAEPDPAVLRAAVGELMLAYEMAQRASAQAAGDGEVQEGAEEARRIEGQVRSARGGPYGTCCLLPASGLTLHPRGALPLPVLQSPLRTRGAATSKLGPSPHQVLLSLALCHQQLGDAPACLACVRALRQVSVAAGPGGATATGGVAAHPAVALLAFAASLAVGDAGGAQGEALGIVASEAADREACLGVVLELLSARNQVGPEALHPSKQGGGALAG